MRESQEVRSGGEVQKNCLINVADKTSVCTLKITSFGGVTNVPTDDNGSRRNELHIGDEDGRPTLRSSEIDCTTETIAANWRNLQQRLYHSLHDVVLKSASVFWSTARLNN